MRLTIALSGTNPVRVKPGVKQVRQLIYKALRNADPQYAAWLHDVGCQGEMRHAHFKPFVFSHPYIVRQHGKDTAMFKICSNDKDFLGKFTVGAARVMLEQSCDGELGISHIQKQTPPGLYAWTVEKRMFCLSPIIIQKRKDEGWHENANNPETVKALRGILAAKYYAIVGNRVKDESPFEIVFDNPEASVQRFAGREVPGFMSAFTIRTTRDLFETAYSTGLGHRNGMGFGMIEEDDKEKINKGGN